MVRLRQARRLKARTDFFVRSGIMYSVNRTRLITLFFIAVLVLAGSAHPVVYAQTAKDVEARRAQLQRELEEEEKAIAAQTLLLQAKQKDTATVAGEINLLKSQIAKAQASIKAKKVAIDGLQSDIVARTTKIKALDAKIKEQQASLSELLRQVRDTQQLSLAEVVLDERNLTEVFQDVDDADAIQVSLDAAFRNMRASQSTARQEQIALEQKKNAEYDAQQAIEAERKKIEQKEAERQVVLAINKTQENSYATLLAERQRRAAQIRAQLFGLRDSAPIPFGKALEYANLASQKTGVRPAFILAILQQESSWGANVGTCNRPGDAKKWQDIMPGQSDIAKGLSKRDDESAFLRIVKELGFNPDGVPLSCPWGNGWGGAMGPAQFIPTTWELLKGRISSLLGGGVPNPWEPHDAFMASAIYLSDLGAADKTPTAERTAACRYYSGQNCYKPNGTAGPGLTYGTQVVAKALNIQTTMIDPLQNN